MAKVNNGKFIAFFLMAIFLFPSVVKLEHHHHEFVCHVKHEKRLHKHHDKCAICNFHFSLFTEDTTNVNIAAPRHTDTYNNTYAATGAITLPEYSFLLRAPPVLL